MTYTHHLDLNRTFTQLSRSSTLIEDALYHHHDSYIDCETEVTGYVDRPLGTDTFISTANQPARRIPYVRSPGFRPMPPNRNRYNDQPTFNPLQVNNEVGIACDTRPTTKPRGYSPCDLGPTDTLVKSVALAMAHYAQALLFVVSSRNRRFCRSANEFV